MDYSDRGMAKDFVDDDEEGENEEEVEIDNPFKALKFMAYKRKHNDELEQDTWSMMNNKLIVKNML